MTELSDRLKDHLIQDLTSQDLSPEMRWAQRWDDCLPPEAHLPHVQLGAVKGLSAPHLPDIQVVPFLVGRGLDTRAFFSAGLTVCLATTLRAAPFITVAGASDALDLPNADPGVRHPQGFAVIYSDLPLPLNPVLADSTGADNGYDRAMMSVFVNRAFDNAAIPRPEVVLARRAADSAASGWIVNLRLYGRVTPSIVADRVSRISTALDGARVSVSPSPQGCILDIS